MLKFIRKSPFGLLLGAAAIVLVVSPEAREELRKVVVKGTTVVLNFVDQVKNSSFLTSLNPPELMEAPAEPVADDISHPNK